MMQPETCGVVGLAFLGGSYMAEAFRSGLESVAKIIYDNSSHYRSYLDIGWKADGK